LEKKPRHEKTIAFQLRFSPALLADLEEIASEDGRSVANLIRWIAERHVRSVRLTKQIHEPDDFSDLLAPRPAPGAPKPDDSKDKE
jgi:hypothetical protein